MLPKASFFPFNDEISIYQTKTNKSLLKPFQDCEPYKCFHHSGKKAKDFYLLLKKLKYPKDFLPNFSLPPKRTFTFNHSLLGPTTVEILLGKLDKKDIEWHFAYDQQGRIWIDRIAFKDRQVNSYGLASLVIDSGLLTNKPLEYEGQAIDLLRDQSGLKTMSRSSIFSSMARTSAM